MTAFTTAHAPYKPHRTVRLALTARGEGIHAQCFDQQHDRAESLDFTPVEQDVGIGRGGRGVDPMAGGLNTVARYHQGPNHLLCTELIS